MYSLSVAVTCASCQGINGVKHIFILVNGCNILKNVVLSTSGKQVCILRKQKTRR